MKNLFYLLLMDFAMITLINTTKAQADDRGYIVRVGDTAPDNFALQLTNGKIVTLKELKGRCNQEYID